MFQRIVVVDKTGLRPWALDELRELSSLPLRAFDDVPASAAEAAKRIGDADCAFVSWSTQLDAAVLKACGKLAYVGMCCSLYSSESANVDIEFAQANDIAVEGIRDYGDEGVIEFVTAELIRLLKGMGDQQWRSEPVELTGRKVGIVGLGTVGRLLADRLRSFGSEVFYFNRSRKQQAEEAGIAYLPLGELLETVEILSMHLPKNTTLLSAPEFDRLGAGKIVVNTSLGAPFAGEDFAKWLDRPGNYGILDGDGAVGLDESLHSHPRVLYSPIVAGWTMEAKERLSQKVLANVRTYLASR